MLTAARFAALTLVASMSIACSSTLARPVTALSAPESTTALAGALRVCAWGNAAACDDLAARLNVASGELTARLADRVRDAGSRSDEFSTTIERCRAGEARSCDDGARALVSAASGARDGDRLAVALLDAIDPAPARTASAVTAAR